MQVGRLPYQPDPKALRYHRPSFWSGVREWLSGSPALPDISIAPDVFTARYCQALESLTEGSAGKVDPSQGLVSAFRAATSLLPPQVAVALAGEAAQSLIGAKEEARAASSHRVEAAPQVVKDILNKAGQPLPTSVWITTSTGLAHASLGEMALSPSLISPTPTPTLAFVVGHENDHLVSGDCRADVGIHHLQQALQDHCQALPDRIEPERLLETFQQGLRILDHEREYRCDQAGLQVALAQGFSPREVAGAVSQLLWGLPESDLHPAGSARVQKLERELGLT